MDAGVSELFPHVRIVMGMVVGLGITKLLTGYAGLIQHPRRTPLSPIHLLWGASILVELVLFWWWEFELYGVKSWSFGLFAFLIGYAVTLYLLAALIFPDKIDEYDGYEDYFLKRRHWFFAILGATFLLDIVDTVVKGEPYFDTLGIRLSRAGPGRDRSMRRRHLDGEPPLPSWSRAAASRLPGLVDQRTL